MLPILNSTGDAVEFGKVATIEEVAELKELAKVYKSKQTKTEGLSMDERLEELESNAVWAYKGQFVREAIEVAEGTFNFL